MSNHKYHFSRQEAAHHKFKFYKHLKLYLCFVGFMLFSNIFLHADIHFYSVAFWWGFGIVIHYLRTFGWADLNEQPAQQQQPEQRYEAFTEPEVEEFVELKQPLKSWRDRDLV